MGVLLDTVSIPLEANGQTSWLIDAAFPGADTSGFVGRCAAPRLQMHDCPNRHATRDLARLAAVLRDAGRVALLDARLGVLRVAVLQGKELAHGVCPPRQLGSGRL